MSYQKKLEEFIVSYEIALLWSSIINEGKFIGDNFDSHFDSSDFSSEADSKTWLECEKFVSENEALLDQVGTYSQHGHDFALTRNGHGADFRDRNYNETVADILFKEAQKFSEVYLYIDSNLKVCHD